GSMSQRVMTILKSFVPHVEPYSIDEAFLDLRELRHVDFYALAIEIRDTVMSHTGLACTIGIGSTKAIAKMANRYAKTKKKHTGVHLVDNVAKRLELLRNTE